MDKVGKKTDKTTQAGRDVYITPEGESVSEKSVTLKVGDEYVNVPSIHDGIMYSEDAIYDMLVEGSIKPTSKHKTVEDAVKAAQERSDNLVFAEGGVVNPEIDYVAADAETDMPTPSDRAREQMASMGLNAPSILSSRNETRTEEEIDADRQTLAEVAPGTGDILAVKNYPEDMSTAKEIISQGLDEGELSSILGGVALAGLATVGLLPSVTGVGAGAKVAKKAVKENLKKNLVKEFGDDGASKVVDTVGEASQPIKVIGVKPPKKTVKAYKLFKVNKKTGELYPLFVKMGDNKPIELNSWTKAEAGALNEKTGKVKSSLGDLAYRPGFHAGDLPIATHIGGKSGDVKKPNYRPDDQVWAEVEMSDDVDWQSVALQRARKKKDGNIDVKTAHITDQLPEGGHYRYKTNPNMTGNWLIGGELKVNRILTNDEVKSINDAAGVADLPRLSELNMAEGGTVPMKEQMEMFEDGGLLQEGGTVDPVSGNDVPPGSTQEEVRDDIPAQLSEGEFVFPADVVRYIGLGNLMKIRQDAKMGLKMMDDMGQMGNSDEATMPDDLPFDLNDLDMEDDGVVEFAEGGLAGADTNTGVFYTPAAAKQPIGVTQPVQPLQAASSQYIAPQQYVTPTVEQVTPEFEQFISPAEGSAPELRKYINTETGEEVSITFINGQPVTPIPAGYVPASEYVAPETAKTERVTTPTTRTVEEGEGENGASPATAFGGFANSLDSDAYSKMTAELGMYQGLSLNPKAALGSELAGKATPKDVSTAMYQAKVAAIADLGIAKVDGNTIDYTDDDGTTKKASKEDLDYIAEVAGLAKDLVINKGIDPKEAGKQAVEKQKQIDAAKKSYGETRTVTRDGQTITIDPFGGTDSGDGDSGGVEESTGGYETSTGEAMVAKGGLMDKAKLTKQMKRSGLASK